MPLLFLGPQLHLRTIALILLKSSILSLLCSCFSYILRHTVPFIPFFTCLSASSIIRICFYWFFFSWLWVTFSSICACLIIFHWLSGVPDIRNFLITTFCHIPRYSVLGCFFFFLSAMNLSYLWWVQSSVLSKTNLSQHYNATYLWILPNAL